LHAINAVRRAKIGAAGANRSSTNPVFTFLTVRFRTLAPSDPMRPAIPQASRAAIGTGTWLIHPRLHSPDRHRSHEQA
jgi:hypothetical protein